jgi:hypothetical protein
MEIIKEYHNIFPKVVALFFISKIQKKYRVQSANVIEKVKETHTRKRNNAIGSIIILRSIFPGPIP